jgi:hypothetical protein
MASKQSTAIFPYGLLMGKTTLAVKLAEQVQHQWLWSSLLLPKLRHLDSLSSTAPNAFNVAF